MDDAFFSYFFLGLRHGLVCGFVALLVSFVLRWIVRFFRFSGSSASGI